MSEDIAQAKPTAMEEKRAAKLAEETKRLEALEKLIPTPTGYHVLIALPNVEDTYGDTGLLKSTKTVHEEYILSTIGIVVDMGGDAYRDKERYPNGPWCKQGDYVMFRVNSGTRFTIGQQEYRLINDDSVQAVVPDPRAISRAS